MNRDLMFRAFDEQHKIMYENFQFIKSGEDGNDWIVFTASNIPFDSDWKDNPYFRQQLKVMQFTGLKDKNGVDIYEGDIIGCLQNGKQLGAIERVEFSYGCFTLRHRNLPIWDFLGISDEFEIEVLGNIFEHPHLLTT